MPSSVPRAIRLSTCSLLHKPSVRDPSHSRPVAEQLVQHAAADVPPISHGDVLFIKGSGGIVDIGTAAGILGHVVLALASPERLAQTSYEVAELLRVWPTLDVSQVWLLQTVDCSRDRAGLHRSKLLLYVDARMSRFLLLGEKSEMEDEERLTFLEQEEVSIWQSPPELRSRLQHSDVVSILEDMKATEQSWSFATAARAFLTTVGARPLSQGSRSCAERSRLLQELRDCWEEAPICTSVVIVFWQRYISTIAHATGQDELELILRWMPMKADRGLPGDLLGAMRRSGWTCKERIHECLVGKAGV